MKGTTLSILPLSYSWHCRNPKGDSCTGLLWLRKFIPMDMSQFFNQTFLLASLQAACFASQKQRILSKSRTPTWCMYWRSPLERHRDVSSGRHVQHGCRGWFPGYLHTSTHGKRFLQERQLQHVVFLSYSRLDPSITSHFILCHIKPG